MPTIEDVLDQVDGLRRDAANRVQERFDSVSELARASTDQLTAISGIGQVMADRIRTAAERAVEQGGELPDRAKETTARAAASADRAIDQAAESARRTVDDLEARSRTNVRRLHASGDRAVDEGAGIVGKVWHAVTAPARMILDKLRRRG